MKKDKPDEPGEQPEYLTLHQVAKILNISYETACSRFRKEPGVIDLTPKEKQKPGYRRRRLLRIPRGVLSMFLDEHRIR